MHLSQNKRKNSKYLLALWGKWAAHRTHHTKCWKSLLLTLLWLNAFTFCVFRQIVCRFSVLVRNAKRQNYAWLHWNFNPFKYTEETSRNMKKIWKIQRMARFPSAITNVDKATMFCFCMQDKYAFSFHFFFSIHEFHFCAHV